MPQTDQLVKEQVSRLQFAFTADSAAMTAARDRIMDFLHQQEIGEPEEIDILVALQEALANAVLHGCKNDPSQVVRCSVGVNAGAVTIVITDPGEGFDTEAVCAGADGAPNLTEHGRGICLMRGLVDEVTFSHGGSQVTLRKLRTQNA